MPEPTSHERGIGLLSPSVSAVAEAISVGGATFLPIDQPTHTEMLLNEVWRSRQATLLALGLKLGETYGPLCRESGFSDAIREYSRLPAQMRRRLMGHPPFLVWLKKTILSAYYFGRNQPSDVGELPDRLAEFATVLANFEKSRARDEGDEILAGIPIQRFDVDPLVKDVTPPSYWFPNAQRAEEIEARTAYKLPVFREVATTALWRVREAWPEAYHDFTQFVRTIVHLVDAQFRSCSAERYNGVIFVTADDETLLDVEESLVHEYGHQILYDVIEVEPLFLEDAGQTFALPWSGAERDFYGYFHAFYIYILLAHYFARVRGRSAEEQERAWRRGSEIVAGLVKALPDFESADRLTPVGRALFANLARQVRQLQQAYADPVLQPRR